MDIMNKYNVKEFIYYVEMNSFFTSHNHRQISSFIHLMILPEITEVT